MREIPLTSCLTSRPLRLFVLLLGIGLVVLYGAMLIVIAVNLPDSWVGLILVIVGLAGGLSGVLYFRSSRAILLVPLAAALTLTMALAIGILLLGKKVDVEWKRMFEQGATPQDGTA